MNFLYIKKLNAALNRTDFSLDLRQFINEDKAIEFCNRVRSFNGVYSDIKNNVFYAYSVLSDTPINSNLYIEDNSGSYILIKDLRFYSSVERKNIILEGEDSLKLLADNKIISYPKNTYNPNVDNAVDINVLSAIQEEANCIFILYKCDTEEDRLNMNWGNAKLETIIYTSSPVVELKSFLEEKLIGEGKYIVRQIYFIDVEEGEFEFLSLFRLCNIISYINNVAVKKSWIPDIKNNNYVYHNYSVKLKKGVHSIINDFSFDTNNTTFKEIEDGVEYAFELNTSQVFRKKNEVEYRIINEVLYKENPLMVNTFINNENKYFIKNCIGPKSEITSSKICQEIFNKDYFSEEARLEFKKIFIDHLAPEDSENYLLYHPGLNVAEEVIKFLYMDGENKCKNDNNNMDFDAVRFIKERIESYFIKMFYNIDNMIDSKNIEHIKFLLPILSKCGEISKTFSKDLLYINFLEECYSENSKLVGKGICELVEKELRNTNDVEVLEKITTIIDKRDFIFCTNYNINDNTYGFENDKLRCEKTVLSNSDLTNYLLSSKCTDDDNNWLGGEYCIQRSLNPGNIENKQRKLFYQQILSSKDRINKLVDGGEIESLADFINYSVNEFLDGENKYENIDFLISEPMVEICGSSEGNDKYFDLCDGIHSPVKYIKEEGNDIENKKLNDAKEMIYILEKNRKLLSVGKKCLENNQITDECKFIFNTDNNTDMILYSGEVFKFCKKNPFNSDCIDYYENISKKKIEGFANKYKSYDFIILLFLIIIISIAVVIIMKKPLKNLFSLNQNT